MHIQASIFLLAASGARATAVLAQRVPSSDLVSRDVSQGWSLQAGSAPTDAHSCGNGAYCPISLHCNSMVNNHQVAACCSSSSDCRGEVENAPKCADSSWNLWVGYDGNGFCCEGGLLGVYDISKSVAGTCVSSDNVGSLRPAVLTSTGTGSAATPAALPASPSSSVAGSAPTPSPATTAKAGSSSTVTAAGSSTPLATVSSSSKNNTSTATSSSSTSSSTSNAGEKMTLGLSLIGAAFLAGVHVVL